MKKKMHTYLGLTRPNYHGSFFEVVIGVFFALQTVSAPISVVLLKTIGIFFCFAIFYGGIYAINDIADWEQDQKHVHKKYRPIPSGKITVAQASIFAGALLVIGALSAYLLFGIQVLGLFLLFFAINLCYTFILKHIVFVELLANCLTHPLRLVLGAALFGATIPPIFLVAFYFLTAGVALNVRLIMLENDGHVARPTLRYYTSSRIRQLKLVFLFIVCVIALMDKSTNPGWYVLVIALYIMFPLNLPMFAPLTRSFRRTYIGRNRAEVGLQPE